MQNNAPSPLKTDLNGILAAKEDYLRQGDPTEYQFVRKQGVSWDEWLVLVNNPEAGPIIEKWRQELALKLSSEAFSRILEASRGETRDALGANKYIFEALTEDKKTKVGRPSKEAILREASKLHEDDQAREIAYNRIFQNTNT